VERAWCWRPESRFPQLEARRRRICSVIGLNRTWCRRMQTVDRAHAPAISLIQGKPIARWGRKASGPQGATWDSGVAGEQSLSETARFPAVAINLPLPLTPLQSAPISWSGTTRPQ
jgi:hypothetical protein